MASAQELDVDELARGGARRAAARSRRYEAERTIEARGRIENLQELVGVAREYRRAVRGAVAGGVPAVDLARLRPGRDPRRARRSSR